MKERELTILRRFTILIFSLITVLGLLFGLITYLATTHYHEASTQLLNKDVAAHIAKFTSPFTSTGIDKQKADSVFQNAMILSPSAEVYFLDPGGKVIYFHASEKDIRQWQVDLLPIQKYLDAKGEKYIKGSDPKEAAHDKIFSVQKVVWNNASVGYIYVILGSKKSEGLMGLLFGSHILNLAIKGFVIIILLSFLFSYLYLKRIKKTFQKTVAVLRRFEKGDYNARFDLKPNDELEPVTHAFNRMADLLSSSIDKLQRSEQERKAFIASISHDLRTPLAIARGYMETLMLKKEKGDVTDEEKEKYSQLIYTKILQIETLVKQLFELSKMEAVEFSSHREPFVLSEIVQEAVNTFQLIVKEHNIHLKCAQCPYHVWVNADVGMMERVVQNLIENAIKNTPDNGHIECRLSVEENNMVFAIQNEGPPLPPDLLQWINDPNDGEGISGNRPKKLGLGLVIVKKILSIHESSLNAHINGDKNILTFILPIYSFPS